MIVHRTKADATGTKGGRSKLRICNQPFEMILIYCRFNGIDWVDAASLFVVAAPFFSKFFNAAAAFVENVAAQSLAAFSVLELAAVGAAAFPIAVDAFEAVSGIPYCGNVYEIVKRSRRHDSQRFFGLHKFRIDILVMPFILGSLFSLSWCDIMSHFQSQCILGRVACPLLFVKPMDSHPNNSAWTSNSKLKMTYPCS
ncbi:hypothetical protein CEXT_769861 [Caerostris extrusa]|uniref:Uncharacterized protein n=1 Tax=Caerostris extrusa TaxID=172846 RepID=A0AAV4YFD6_CAEEX|nr:hypothetical protein CEXT_769861 [Caerostris extrusa]